MTTTDTTPAARLLALCDEAEALAAKATPGPWAVENGSDLEGTPFCHIEGWTTSDHTDWLCLAPGDAEFIAASRTLVPKLAAALEQAVTALGEANVMADEVKAYGDCEHNEFGRVFTAMHNYRAALRRMAGGE